MAKWQRPKTTRRYIHPPMSERFYTLWSEGKVVFGEAEAALGAKYFDLVSSGIWFFDKAKSIYTKYNLDDSGKCVVWYVACQEYYWFLYFLRHGMRERCEEILRDIYRYAMTDEYYMIERYHENEPYFVPWSPNASANGRVINMILDFCK